MQNNFRVSTGDVEEAVVIIHEASQWLIDQNIPLWKQEELTKENLLASLKPDNFCVGWVGDEAAAAMILQWQDPIFWPDIKENESGFIHKFCGRRKYAGTGVTKKMFNYAIECCKQNGINYLRLDTKAERTKLRQLYEGFGFKPVGNKIIGNSEFILYELKIK